MSYSKIYIPVLAPSPSYTAIKSPIAVVGAQYCISEYPIDLVIVRKVMALSLRNFTVTDIKGNIMFKLEAQWSLYDHRILRDPAGNPIVTLRQNIISMHGRWQVFRGESCEKKDLLFTAKTSSLLQLKTKMDVFLANNTNQEVPDFTLDGGYSPRSGVIYAGDGKSKAILAQMYKKETMKSIWLGKDNFRVTIYPNVDYAFIVALIVILDDINNHINNINNNNNNNIINNNNCNNNNINNNALN